MRLFLFLLQKYKNHIISENNFSEMLFFFNEQLLINAKDGITSLCNTVSYYIYNVYDYEITYTGACS